MAEATATPMQGDGVIALLVVAWLLGVPLLALLLLDLLHVFG